MHCVIATKSDIAFFFFFTPSVLQSRQRKKRQGINLSLQPPSTSQFVLSCRLEVSPNSNRAGATTKSEHNQSNKVYQYVTLYNFITGLIRN